MRFQMGLQDVELKKEYRSLRDNVPRDFYVPLLKLANLYQRAVGYFSSTALSVITPGLCAFIRNGGKIQIVASPKLSEDDIEAIEKGYKERNEVFQEALMRELDVDDHYRYADRLNLLANLIADNKLDIKIVTTTANNGLGMYHEKLGLIHDDEGNVVAFSGSMNETITALKDNYEAFDVFCSWKSEDQDRVLQKENSFTAIWNDCEANIEVVDFTEVRKEIIQKYKIAPIDYNLDETESEEALENPLENVDALYMYEDKGFVKPKKIRLYDYQLEAITNWRAHGYRGIFDMATGTGKTYTGLSAAADLCGEVHRLAIFIVCPYQHLVEQWVSDIRFFGMNPIIGYSGSEQKDYKKRLKNAVFDFQLGVKNFFCFVCTNATFASKPIQNEARKLGLDTLLIVDEAHNFGANNLSKTLDMDFEYRLALSATLERHKDEDGTAILKSFFGDKCIEYSLDKAIKEGKLTPYEYHPVVVSLSEVELEKYQALTTEIGKCIMKKRNGKTALNKKGERLVLQRARVVAGAVEKVERLRDLMEEYKHDTNMLVYCGATRLMEQDTDEIEIDEDIRQIDYISRMLNFDLRMNTAQFTSREDAEERKRRIQAFDEEEVQALVAIKCLDEGVNIPSIRTAFILASTTNPKEYIQRRGRVLRLAHEKDRAVIYDFITLPRKLDIVINTDSELAGREVTLVKNELRRMIEFKDIAMNAYKADRIVNEIIDAYELYDFIEDGMPCESWEE